MSWCDLSWCDVWRAIPRLLVAALALIVKQSS
jgi:hypothetical protein